MLKVGIIGLGNIGKGVAIPLAKAGMLAACYDVRANAAEDLEGIVKMSSSASDVAKICDVVVLAMFDAMQAHEVIEGKKGLIVAKNSSLVIVLLSTVSITELFKLDSIVACEGIQLVDCGVTTGGKASSPGQLVSMVGGDESAVDYVTPALEAFSRKVVYMGPLGSGMSAKIAKNLIVYSVWRAEYEGFMLAKAAGVKSSKLIEIIRESESSGDSLCFWAKRSPENSQEFVEDSFREYCADVLEKDIDAACELADKFHLDLQAGKLARATKNVIVGLEDEPEISSQSV